MPSWDIRHQAATEGQPGHFVQIFNLDTKEKPGPLVPGLSLPCDPYTVGPRLGVYQCPEQIVFWRWLAPRMLALVCAQDHRVMAFWGQKMSMSWLICSLAPLKGIIEDANICNTKGLSLAGGRSHKKITAVGIQVAERVLYLYLYSKQLILPRSICNSHLEMRGL